jgi:methyltransferase (TIGR00027 family)
MDGEAPSRTAQVVAAERALLCDLGVLDDSAAASMLGPRLAALHRAARRLPPRTWARSVTLAGLAGRVRWFDAEVAAAMTSAIAQVVTVGAGYDSRPWRLGAVGTTFFEVDHPATQADKRRRAPAGGPTYVAADLVVDDVVVALGGAGFDHGARALFVVEGVTMYLDEAVLEHLFDSLSGAAAPGSRLVVDFYPASRPTTGVHRRQLLLQRLARVGGDEGLRTGVDRDDAARLLERTGWRPTEVVAAREAAVGLVPGRSGLPTTRVSEHKTFVAAVRA